MCDPTAQRGCRRLSFVRIKVGVRAFSLRNTVLQISLTALGVRLALLNFEEAVSGVFLLLPRVRRRRVVFQARRDVSWSSVVPEETSGLREVFRNPSHLLVVFTPSSCRALCLTLAQDRTCVSRE